MTSKNCEKCDSEPATHGIHCRLCHAVMLAVVTIRSNWGPKEYKTLGTELRSVSLHQYQSQSQLAGAATSSRLGFMLIRLRHLSGADEASFKSALFMHLNREAMEIEGIAKMPGGLEGWKDQVATALGPYIRKLRAIAEPRTVQTIREQYD